MTTYGVTPDVVDFNERKKNMVGKKELKNVINPSIGVNPNASIWSYENGLHIIDEIMMKDANFSCIDLVGKENYIKIKNGNTLNINLKKVDISTIVKEPELGTIASLYANNNVNKLYNVIWKYGWYDLSDNKWSYINRYNIMSSDYKIKSSSEFYSGAHKLWNYSEKKTDSNGNTIVDTYVHENTNIIFKNTNIKCKTFKGDIISQNVENIKIKTDDGVDKLLTAFLFNSIKPD